MQGFLFLKIFLLLFMKIKLTCHKIHLLKVHNLLRFGHLQDGHTTVTGIYFWTFPPKGNSCSPPLPHARQATTNLLSIAQTVLAIAQVVFSFRGL